MAFDWDDIPFFLAVERAGRLASAARRLRVSHTTVARHIDRLEEAMGTPLFDRTAEGLTLTQAGIALRDRAQRMEAAALDIADTVCTEDKIVGSVRVGAPDGIGNAVLSRVLPGILSLHQGLEIELVPVPMTHRLWKREVDIAISLDRPETGRLIMRKLIDYDLRLYAAPAYLDQHGTPDGPDDLPAHPFVGYIDDLLYTPELDFNRSFGADLRIVYKSATVQGQVDAVRAGAGLGVLPCFMADGLVPVLADDLRFARTYWMLYPEDYRDLARIRTVADYIHAEIQAMSARFRA